jgi:hypothetical protein
MIMSLSSAAARLLLQVGSDDDGYSVRMKLKHFLRYLSDPTHAPADDSPLYIFDGAMRGNMLPMHMSYYR